MKKALITGVTGQDGSYLAEFLLQKGYEVYGITKSTYLPGYMNFILKHKNFTLQEGDIIDKSFIDEVIYHQFFDEIYHLAAVTYLPFAEQRAAYTIMVNSIGTVNLLDSVAKFSRDSRVFFPSSSEVLDTSYFLQNEDTPLKAYNFYGATKLLAHQACLFYKENYDLFVSIGIPFNHTSTRRKPVFVCRKIVETAVDIYLGNTNKLVLGNIKAQRDWGYAPDFVRAFWMILQYSKPDIFVLGTGKLHTVKDFVKEAFEHLKLDYEEYLQANDPALYRKDTQKRVADASKIAKNLGWQPLVTFEEMIKIMVEEVLKRNLSTLRKEKE